MCLIRRGAHSLGGATQGRHHKLGVNRLLNDWLKEWAHETQVRGGLGLQEKSLQKLTSTGV